MGRQVKPEAKGYSETRENSSVEAKGLTHEAIARGSDLFVKEGRHIAGHRPIIFVYERNQNGS